MKRFRSVFERTAEVAKRLMKPSWVKRYHGGDEEEAAKCLADRHGFGGRPDYMRHLCELLADFPDQTTFDQAVKEYREDGLRRMAEGLARCEITDDPTLKRRDDPLSELAGDCYRLAYYFVVENAPDGSHLVHGRIRGSVRSEYIGHAWVELPGDVVYDGVLQRFYRRKCYYAKRNAKRVQTFPKDSVVMKYLQKRYFGEWDA
jgi:hypothetical protein